ncbi:zinc transporter 1 [Drosophila eugracilis]|uniref:zinc transporter 1 n=1 Tax=Drosophila eugracilis TaxID=29029 RepID=UPI0007E78501|nr:zinc transporter 1 [Drosophila eugracilis]XP_017080800.1 zinc transporter 1 [Drosophila eugracilis]XP_017080801.1 zinc transporter 1 [Drosophila eugracilis]XP_017080802.1 zinc transporter 1 [Drosophila eugracilis]
MPVKEILQRCRPIPLYTVLVLSICYFVLQLVFSHLTHGLTLLMASHHNLCNIFALGGCILTIKHSKQKPEAKDSPPIHTKENGNDPGMVVSLAETDAQAQAKRECREQKLRNTFGWARIDILTMLIVFIILASLSFSLVVEALQTLVHIDHQDTMHLPIHVMMVGFLGLILNGVTYLLIGGYTLHQGSFLHLTPGGNVVLERPMSSNLDLSLTPMQRQLSKSRNDRQLRDDLEAEFGSVYFATKRQGAVEMFRDVSSTIFVIVCAAIVYVAEDEQHTAKFIDPVLSIFSCVLLVTLSYPYMKESCLILLQTIPGSIDLEIFERTLVTKFPEIVSYHDLHIWQLAAHRYVATIHIQFQNPKLYLKIIEQVRAYFHDQGIGAVTIQPEFYPSTNKNASASLECLMQCQAVECIEKVCCRDSRTDLREVCDAPGGRISSSPAKCQGNGHDHSKTKSKSCAELSAVVVEKPKELNAGQLLKSQDQTVAKSMPKLEATCLDTPPTKADTTKPKDSPTSSD